MIKTIITMNSKQFMEKFQVCFFNIPSKDEINYFFVDKRNTFNDKKNIKTDILEADIYNPI